MIRSLFGFVIGALLGTLVGLTVGILFAPASGEETRGQIRERSSAVSAEVKNAALARKAELENRIAQMRAPQNTEVPPTA